MDLKQFKTPEECLQVMGSHCLEEDDGSCKVVGCLVMHYGDPLPFKYCRHCPYQLHQVVKQERQIEWVESIN